MMGEACRFLLKETLGKNVSWAIEQMTREHKKQTEVMTALGLVST